MCVARNGDKLNDSTGEKEKYVENAINNVLHDDDRIRKAQSPTMTPSIF